MKRLSLLGFFALIAAGLAGCPVWDDGQSFDCGNDPDCGRGGGNPGDICSAPQQCGISQTCGDDGSCHTGDCTLWGCVSGYTCEIGSDGFASCVGGGEGGAGGTGGATGGSGGGGGAPVVWCGHPADCGVGETCSPDDTCKAGDCNTNGCIFGYTCNMATGACDAAANACGADADCAPAGANFECVDGTCKAPADQCFDQNQCSGNKCAGGKCENPCTLDTDCKDHAYLCNKVKGVCTKPAVACVITNECGTDGKSVCVDGACVPRSTSDGMCPEGHVWVENGCIPSQAATFTCDVDGIQDKCAIGSVCVHHSCYISCESNFNACAGLPTFDSCQGITSSSGTYAVCGSAESLGGDCDPTRGITCPTAGQICVDGACK